MGFSLRRILDAIFETRSSGEVSAHTINTLVTWMLEHPSLDTCVEEEMNTASGTDRVHSEDGSTRNVGLGRITRNLAITDLMRHVSIDFVAILRHLFRILSRYPQLVFFVWMETILGDRNDRLRSGA